MTIIKKLPRFSEEIYWTRSFLDVQRHDNIERFKSRAKESTPALLEAGRAFDLDPTDPVEAAVLLRELAEIVFGTNKRGRRRGSKAWNTWRLRRLWEHYTQIKRENPRIKNTLAAEEIKVRWKDIYKGNSVTTLRQRISDAHRAHLSPDDDVPF